MFSTLITKIANFVTHVCYKFYPSINTKNYETFVINLWFVTEIIHLSYIKKQYIIYKRLKAEHILWLPATCHCDLNCHKNFLWLFDQWMCSTSFIILFNIFRWPIYIHMSIMTLREPITFDLYANIAIESLTCVYHPFRHMNFV